MNARTSFGLALIALALVSACGGAAEDPEPQQTSVQPAALQACNVDPEKEVLILDLSVVEDSRTKYPGPWSFGKLFDNLADGAPTVPFVLDWLSHFDRDLEINGFKVPRKEFFWERVVGGWKAASDQAGLQDYDLSNPPFRLLGIANRLDLRQSCDGEVKHAGEARFIFGFIDPSGNVEFGEEILRGTMIIEYHMPASSCEDVRRWARAWHSLGSLELGSAEFNQKLEAITNGFSGPGIATKALAQVRTNELIDLTPWQWREFKLNPAGRLEQVTVANAPDLEVNGTPLLADYVNTNEEQILALEHEVPLTWRGEPFRGGSSDGDPISSHFAAPGIRNNDARHALSLLTCVGCHTDETGAAFFQVGPRALHQPAFPSGFLTGIKQPDPVDPTVVRSFNDLKRRAEDMCGVLASSCSAIETHKASARVH